MPELRSSISIIPQEPIIFSETVRKNLDPTEKYSDEKLWSVLEKVQLKSFISEKIEKLDYMLSEQGANDSQSLHPSHFILVHFIPIVTQKFHLRKN